MAGADRGMSERPRDQAVELLRMYAVGEFNGDELAGRWPVDQSDPVLDKFFEAIEDQEHELVSKEER